MKPKRKMNQPIGSTTIRDGGVRYIKVADDGPKYLRWMQYSRFLWETIHGPVPAGKRVLHKDGDVTNDDIRNLMLGTSSDVLWIHCHKDPKKSAANYRKCHKATAAANRLRGVVNRMQNWLPTRWYAVNLDNQRAWNNPQKNALTLATQLGLQVDGRKLWASVLGYPEGNRAQAIVVRCLTADSCSSDELLRRVTAFSRAIGFRPMTLQTLYVSISALRKRGHLTGSRGRYSLAIPQAAPLAIVRGKQITTHFQLCCRCESVSDLMLGG